MMFRKAQQRGKDEEDDGQNVSYNVKENTELKKKAELTHPVQDREKSKDVINSYEQLKDKKQKTKSRRSW